MRDSKVKSVFTHRNQENHGCISGVGTTKPAYMTRTRFKSPANAIAWAMLLVTAAKVRNIADIIIVAMKLKRK
jgi:hypothetical protein